MHKINTSQICSVKSYVNLVNERYRWKPEIAFLGVVFREEGYYYRTIGEEFMSIKEIEKTGYYTCRDQKVYYKPHLEIKMSDGKVRVVYFNTEQQLVDFMEQDQMKMINWVDIK